MSSSQPKDIAVDMAAGGRFDDGETEAILDAIDLASDQDGTTYLTLKGQRVAAIVPVEVADSEHRRIEEVLHTPIAAGPAARYVSRQSYDNGTRQEVQAVRLTAANYQRVTGWLQGHTENAEWSADPGRLIFGGRRGSYSIPAGWWVVLYTPETTPAHAGAEGWDPDDFEASWIDPAQLEREQLGLAISIAASRRRGH